jgi:uncharacterized protein YifE (UPF0438 family)
VGGDVAAVYSTHEAELGNDQIESATVDEKKSCPSSDRFFDFIVLGSEEAGYFPAKDNLILNQKDLATHGLMLAHRENITSRLAKTHWEQRPKSKAERAWSRERRVRAKRKELIVTLADEWGLFIVVE